MYKNLEQAQDTPRSNSPTYSSAYTCKCKYEVNCECCQCVYASVLATAHDMYTLDAQLPKKEYAVFLIAATLKQTDVESYVFYAILCHSYEYIRFSLLKNNLYSVFGIFPK